jgi:hypothetical protein
MKRERNITHLPLLISNKKVVKGKKGFDNALSTLGVSLKLSKAQIATKAM